jgi:tetratricopeptide (TPR) repeat protein
MTPEKLLLKEALEALEKGDRRQARDLLTRLLKIDHDNPEVWLWMSTAVDSQKESRFCLKEALKLDPQNDRAMRGLSMLGEEVPNLRPLVDIKQARKAWKTSLEPEQKTKIKNRGLHMTLLGYSLLGGLVMIVVIGGVILALTPRYRPDTSPILRWSVTPTFTPTVTAVKNTPLPGGIVPLDSLLESTFTPTPRYVSTPHNRVEAYSLAIRALDKEDYSAAIEYFNQVLITEPGSADIYYQIGECYRLLAQNGNASDAFQSALQSDANFAPAYLGKARLAMYGNSVNLTAAGDFLQTAFELDPNMSDAILEIARLKLRQGDSTSALEWLKKLNSDVSKTAPVESLKAQAYLLVGDSRSALRHIETAIQLDPTFLESYLKKGEVLQMVGDYETSLTSLLTYQAYAGNTTSVESLLARAYFETGETQKALDAVTRILSIHKNDKHALNLRGKIFISRGDFESAEADFDAVLRLDSQSFDGLIGKARCLLSKTYAGAAHNYLERAEVQIETSAQQAEWLYWRAVALVGLDETSAAIRDYEAFLALPTSDIDSDMRATAQVEYSSLVTATATLHPTVTADWTKTPTPKITKTLAAE